MKQAVKKILLVLMLVCMLTGCQGNYETVELKETTPLKQEGVILAQEIQKLKDENGIGSYSGAYEGYKYEWTVFGSDVTEAVDLNLNLEIRAESEQGIAVTLAPEAVFDFPVFLSIYLEEKWNTQEATLYQKDEPVGSVSVTGSGATILNVSVYKLKGEYVIRGEEEISLADDNVENVQETGKETGKEDKQPAHHVTEQEQDAYLTMVQNTGDRVYSSGTQSKKDKYETDPVPEGKPMPVEPENQEVNTQKTATCTFSIECTTILNNLTDLDSDKLELVPSNGVILAPTEITFYEGESVYDVLQRVCRENGIHMEASWTPVYNSAYVEGIHNLYEFDCGSLSGWMYSVNGWYPNYGCSRYQLVQGEVVAWRYTCDLGRDVGCNWME